MYLTSTQKQEIIKLVFSRTLTPREVAKQFNITTSQVYEVLEPKLNEISAKEKLLGSSTANQIETKVKRQANLENDDFIQKLGTKIGSALRQG